MIDLTTVLVMLGIDLISFVSGAVIGSSVRTRLLSETVITLQKDIINLQGMNLQLNNELAVMRAEIRELRDLLGREQQATRHLRANIAQVFQSERDLRTIEQRG